MFQHIVQLSAAVCLSEYIDFQKIALLIHRHASMVEQIRIVGFVKPALGKQKTHMFLQFLTVHKGFDQPLHNFHLFPGKRIGILPVYSGKIRIIHGVFPALYKNCLFLIIDLVK